MTPYAVTTMTALHMAIVENVGSRSNVNNENERDSG